MDRIFPGTHQDSTIKVSEVSGEKGKGGSKGFLALKGNLLPHLQVYHYKIGSKHVG